MNRLNHTRLRRLSPRITVISGAAVGLIVGAAVYSAVSSSAEATKPVAYTAVKPPVAAAPANFSACAANSKLEKDVCVVRVVRTVIAPSASPATGSATAAAPSTTKPASVTKPAAAATRRSTAGSAPAASGTPSAGGGQDSESVQTTAPLSAKAAAEQAAKDAAAKNAAGSTTGRND